MNVDIRILRFEDLHNPGDKNGNLFQSTKRGSSDNPTTEPPHEFRLSKASRDWSNFCLNTHFFPVCGLLAAPKARGEPRLFLHGRPPQEGEISGEGQGERARVMAELALLFGSGRTTKVFFRLVGKKTRPPLPIGFSCEPSEWREAKWATKLSNTIFSQTGKKADNCNDQQLDN